MIKQQYGVRWSSLRCWRGQLYRRRQSATAAAGLLWRRGRCVPPGTRPAGDGGLGGRAGDPRRRGYPAPGGNAVDAAVAVGYALAVTHPQAGNIGGGGFMMLRTKDGKTTAIDFREMAPEQATRDMFLDDPGNPDSKNH